MPLDILGPANAPNAVTERPTDDRLFGTTDTWFKDCSSSAANDGTKLKAAYMNSVSGAFRTVVRGNGNTLAAAPIVIEDNADDGMALKSIKHLIQRGRTSVASDTGSVNAMVVALDPAPPEYIAGMVVRVLALNTNTGPSVLRVGTLANKAVTYVDGSDLVAGELFPGRVAELFYDSNKFVLLNPFQIFQRPRLTTPTTFYVSPSGSDANNGRTVGAPFLTPQRAFTEVSKYDFNGNQVTIKFADGTYTGAGFRASGQMQGAAGPIKLVGNIASPSSCIIDHTQANSPNSNQGAITGVLGAQIDINGFKLQSTYLNGIVSNNAGTNVSVQNVVYGPCAGSHVLAQNLGFLYLNLSDVYSIAGNAFSHFYASNGGRIYNNGLLSAFLTGTPGFSNGFIYANDGAVQLGIAFTGAATGARYNVVDNGIVYLFGIAESSIPGSSAGSAYAGGRLDGALGQDWVAYTPTVSTTTGTVTGAATGSWRKIDKTVFFSISVSIAAASSPGGCLVSAPPIPASLQSAGGGKEIGLTGKAVSWALSSASPNFVLLLADAGNPYVANYNIVFSGFYQIAN